MKKWLVSLCIGVFTLSFNGCSKISPTGPSLSSLQGIKLFSSSVGESYEFVGKWGSYGSGDGQFSVPYGVSVESSTGNVYVADPGNNCIQKFTAGGGFITKWGSYGSGDLQFYCPCGVAVDSSTGNVYVADTRNNRIQKFTAGGGFISYGSKDDQFSQPHGVAVDSAGDVYVADRDNHRIQKFTAGGGFITKWGELGSGDRQFNYPCGVAVDSAGDVYVVDRDNHRIQKFTAGGGFITKWGELGSGDRQFGHPCGVAVDSAGDVYVADKGNHRIQKFTDNGDFLTKWGSCGSGDGQFIGPCGVAVDSSTERVYVADTKNRRIQIFQKSYNTPPGINIEYSDSGVSLNFDNITAGGDTSVTVTNTGPPPKTGFKLLDQYYDINTTAGYSGSISICINYDDTGLTTKKENRLKLYHFSETGWADVTTSLDTENNIICGSTTSLSPFAIIYLDTITANVVINPETINLKSKGKYITAYIELPEGYNVNDIDGSSVKMESPSGAIIPAEWSQVDDYDIDGIADLTVKFDWASVQSNVAVGNVELTVKGYIPVEELNFSGSQSVTVIDVGE